MGVEIVEEELEKSNFESQAFFFSPREVFRGAA